MANQNKWAATPTSRGTVLTTELNSLANGSLSAVGTALDNTTNLDKWCDLELVLASLSPSAGGSITVYLTESNDGGTTYENPPASTDPGSGCQSCTVTVDSTAATAKRITVGPFLIKPKKMKFVLKNNAGVALASSGNTVTAFTYDETNNG
jgi:hypothetical protein